MLERDSKDRDEDRQGKGIEWGKLLSCLLMLNFYDWAGSTWTYDGCSRSIKAADQDCSLKEVSFVSFRPEVELRISFRSKVCTGFGWEGMEG